MSHKYSMGIINGAMSMLLASVSYSEWWNLAKFYSQWLYYLPKWHNTLHIRLLNLNSEAIVTNNILEGEKQ